MGKTISAVNPSEWNSLNERFYKMNPHAYLEHRLRSLVLLISDTTDLSAAWAAGVSYKDFTITATTSDDREQLDRYAALESTVLLHHASESLLRLYLAHAFRTRCPWASMSSLHSFAEFKKQLGALRDDLDLQDRLEDFMEVFVYTSKRENFHGVSEEMWDDQRKALGLILRAALDEVLDRAHIYNAAKHGLALLAGDVGMSFGDNEDGGPLIDQHGPALTYLERAPDWRITTTWVSPERNLALTYLVTEQIRNLWNVAQTHRLRTTPARFVPLKADAVEKVLLIGTKEGFNVSTMSEHLKQDN